MRWLSLACVALVFCSVVRGDDAKSVPPVLNFTMKSLHGDDVNLSKYAGKVVLIVNTASHCGHTPQYKDLEALYSKYKDQGLMILGFPANDFLNQEPGDAAAIDAVCHGQYGVTFDMFAKIVVKGDGQAPLYQYLTSPKTDPKFAGPIRWNFDKFLISRDGQIVNRFDPTVNPMDPQVIGAVESSLK